MLELLKKINSKVNGLIFSFVSAGFIFLILAVLTILYPQIIVYIFVISFGLLAILCFIAGERIYRIKHAVYNFLKFKK